jgi:environmental stress-induced protein Ves
MRIVRSAEYPVQAWKNGGGSARRIAAWPAGIEGYGDALEWHVSLPLIERSGPFSALDGLDRHWMLLTGAGAELHCTSIAEGVDFRARIDRRFEPLAFRGDWTTDCQLLDGAVAALSVLTRRGKGGARLQTVAFEGAHAIDKARDEHCVVLAAEGRVRVLAGGTSNVLEPLDALIGAPGRFESYAVSSMTPGRARVVAIHIA